MSIAKKTVILAKLQFLIQALCKSITVIAGTNTGMRL